MKDAKAILKTNPCITICMVLLLAAGCSKDPKYSLNVTVQPAGSGTVSLSPEGGVYAEGTEVTFTTSPGSEYKFVSWGGTDGSYVHSNKIIMSKDMTVTANFDFRTMIRLQSGSGLNSGAQIFFLALSKSVNYFNLPTDQWFSYLKTDAEWYIDGGVIPFTTEYKDFDLSTGQYYLLLRASGLALVTTLTVVDGRQTIIVSGSSYGWIDLDVVQPKNGEATEKAEQLLYRLPGQKVYLLDE